MVDMNTAVETLLDLAKAAVKKDVMSGEIFALRDLFRGVEWERIPVEKRAQLGARFYDEFRRRVITGIEENGKTQKYQQLYRKIILTNYSGIGGEDDEEAQSI